ncbi:MAG: YbjN domain-containing protein [Propionibacteriales bacterium]|nr:YbjN domain-containing protein [Propionibacteriales bacterium]
MDRVEMDRQAEWLAAYVEKCMAQAWGDEAAGLTNVGDMVMYRWGSAACSVRVESTIPVMVRVMAKAVIGVRPTAKLLREINEVNARSRVVNAWWYDGDVTVECSLFADAVSPESLREACFHVGQVADDIGVGLAALYDGSTPYPPFANDSEDAA